MGNRQPFTFLVPQGASSEAMGMGRLATGCQPDTCLGLPEGPPLRRTIQALAENREPGDLTTLEDPAALEQNREVLE